MLLIIDVHFFLFFTLCWVTYVCVCVCVCVCVSRCKEDEVSYIKTPVDSRLNPGGHFLKRFWCVGVVLYVYQH